MEVRRAVANDAASIAAVLYESFIEYESIYTPEAFAVTTPSEDQIQARWDEGPVWVAVQSTSILGTVSAVLRSEGLYVRSMAVLPAVRGQGTGRLLLQAVENYARLRKLRRLYLSTTPFLHRAIQLYEHSGFHRSDEGVDNLLGTPLFTMVKIL